jgi:hypothetical protein
MCRAPFLLQPSGRILGADNGSPDVRRVLSMMRDGVGGIGDALEVAARLLRKVLDAHPAEDWFVYAIAHIKPHSLPGHYSTPMLMTRAAMEVPIDGVLCDAGAFAHEEAVLLPTHPGECRVAFKPASGKLRDSLITMKGRWSLVNRVAADLGIWLALAHISLRCRMPKGCSVIGLHPLQTTITLSNGVVMNLLQCTIFVSLMESHDDRVTALNQASW